MTDPPILARQIKRQCIIVHTIEYAIRVFRYVLSHVLVVSQRQCPAFVQLGQRLQGRLYQGDELIAFLAPVS